MQVATPARKASKLISVHQVDEAHGRIRDVAVSTPLARNINLSDRYECNVFLKREDLQVVRSYKIRGAFNKISTLSPEEKEKGMVCASAGNHAQGVAYSCRTLEVNGKIFIPNTTPKQKINQVEMFDRDFVEIDLTGDSFDDCFLEALQNCNENGKSFIHPFDDETIIAGQGTVGLEILRDAKEIIDYVFVPIGKGHFLLSRKNKKNL